METTSQQDVYTQFPQAAVRGDTALALQRWTRGTRPRYALVSSSSTYQQSAPPARPTFHKTKELCFLYSNFI